MTPPKPDLAVILTVYNRPEEVLRRTLSHLLVAADLVPELHVILVDDGSDEDHRAAYEPLWRELQEQTPATWLMTSTIAERPQTYHIKGHNNPAYVNNRALQRAQELGAERTLLLSSDTIINDHALHAAYEHTPETVVCGQVTDSGQGITFCSSTKIWPMCWFVLAKTGIMQAVGFDEEYLKGMAFEDNDFMGRLFLRTGQLVIDDQIRCLHQNHPPTAYSDGWEGFRRSEAYTTSKWGGVPFRPHDESLTFQLTYNTANSCVRLTMPNAPGLRRAG